MVGISISKNHGCIVDNGNKVLCWGKNDVGQSSAPNIRFRSVAVGTGFSCGVERFKNKVHCWGGRIAQSLPPGAPCGI